MVTAGRPLPQSGLGLRFAGRSEIFSGLVNILKHSARLDLFVIEGLKVISLLVLCATAFLAFLVEVSERLSLWGALNSGFSLGVISCILANASCVQA